MSYSGLEAVMLANRAALLRFLLARSGSGGDAEDLPGLPQGQPDQPQPAADRAARHPHRLGMEPVTGDRDGEFGISPDAASASAIGRLCATRWISSWLSAGAAAPSPLSRASVATQPRRDDIALASGKWRSGW